MLHRALLIFFFLTSITSAQVTITLPLQGYYRVGQYMPVRIEGAQGFTTISDPGAMPVETDIHDGIAPLLVIRNLSDLKRSSGRGSEERTYVPLLAIKDNDRLVACAPSAIAFAKQLFPGMNVIPLDWDVQEFRRGPAMAWESLDAVILDAPLPEAMSDTVTTALMGNGTTIAIKSFTSPNKSLPWRQTGEYWVLQHDLAGPKNALAGEAAYAPTFGWRPGQTDLFRRQILITAMVLSIFLAAASLARSRRAMPLVLIVVLLSLGATELWRRVRSPVRNQAGTITAFDRYIVQTDTWTYQTAPVSLESTQPCVGNSRPMFVDARQFDRLQIALHWSANMADSFFQFAVEKNTRCAFLTRDVSVGNPKIDSTPVTSPMESVASAMYVGTGDRIVGQVDGGDGWPTVFVDRRR